MEGIIIIMVGGNLLSYTLLMNLLYVAVFMFPIMLMSWAARRKDLPWAVFMVSMAVISVISITRIHSYNDCMALLVFIAVIVVVNGLGWLIFGRKGNGDGKHRDDGR